MSNSASPAVNIGSTYGASFLGLIFSSVLYGVTIVQSWNYYWHGARNRDSMIMKGFILLLLVLDTVQTAFHIYVLYWYLIQNFADVNNLDINMWAMEAQVSINYNIAFLIQLFYARRLYLTSHSIAVPVIIAGLTVFGFGLGIAFTIREPVLKRFSRYRPLIWLISAGLGGGALVDILIAISMCWCLYHKRTGYPRTDSMIMTLMIYCINTGLLTSVLATASLISFAISPTTVIAQAFYGPLGKCYVNSLLALLNNRESIREGSSHVGSDNGLISYKPGPGPTSISVTVHRTATMAMDLVGNKDDDPDTEPSTLELKRLGASTSRGNHGHDMERYDLSRRKDFITGCTT
ncbi:hypothetical protein BJV74DRAFT_181642 [Russula compacta]|nr:hypothetical protein BJV74DRAFT_181642 [Russula compacta]